MKNIKVFKFVLLSIILVLGSSVFAAADEPWLKDIPLQWNPTENVKSLKAIDLSIFQNAHFMIKPFNELRKNPGEIGVNIEKRLSVKDLPVTTKDNVATWLTYHFTKTLSDFDIDVVKENGNFTLEADIVKFFSIEKSVYKAELTLKVRLLSKSNAVVWEDMISGDATRFGKSYSAVNYYESLSNAVMFTVYSLLKNDSFKRAVQKGK